MTATNQFDAIVVGSGITGGWAAKELTEKGLKVLMIERGRLVEHVKDYVTEHKRRYREEYPIQSQHFLFNEYTEHFFVNDKDAPYVAPPERPFTWFRGHQLGGRSLTWGRHTYRLSEMDFNANKADGHGIDWPIRYKDLAPWYDHVEQFIGVSGKAEGLGQLPDGKFLPPMELNCVEQHFKESVEQAFGNRTVTIGRVAVLTKPHNGRASCHYCGPCERGCSAGAYFSTQSSTLPAAQKTGNLTVVTDLIVERLETDAAEQRITGVAVIDANTGQRRIYKGRIVFLCASALASTQILLNSRSQQSPTGFANSSGVLGHYLMDHGFVMNAFATVPGFEDRYYTGNRPNSMYIPRFRNIDEAEQGFVRGYGYQGLAWRSGWQRGIQTPGFGKALKDDLRQPGPWMMMLGSFVECLPRRGNTALLDEHKCDKWGVPQLKIEFSHGQNEQKLAEDATAQAVAMLNSAGAKVLHSTAEIAPGGAAIHEMGTARMGNDPRESVLNAFNQSHDVANLFVTDGASMTSSACQNPSLTYMALTARACHYAVEQFRAGTL